MSHNYYGNHITGMKNFGNQGKVEICGHSNQVYSSCIKPTNGYSIFVSGLLL